MSRIARKSEEKQRLPITPFGVIKRAASDYWDESFVLMVCNLIWFFCQVTVILGPAATVALFQVTNNVAKGEFAKLGAFTNAIKHNFLESWKWGAMNLLAVGLALYSINFYASGAIGDFGVILAGITMAVLVLWLLNQMLAIPLWLKQRELGILGAMRRANVLQATNPILVALIVIVSLVILVISVIILVPLVMGTMAFLATLGSTTVALLTDPPEAA